MVKSFPLFFIIVVINDVDDELLSQISKLVDDIKVCRAVSEEEEADIL